MLWSAIPLAGVDVERFLAFLMPSALQVAAASMAPIPVPTLQGLTFAGVQIRQDGTEGEFATLSADVR